MAVRCTCDICGRFPEHVDEQDVMCFSELIYKNTAKEPIYDGDGYAPDGSFVWDE